MNVAIDMLKTGQNIKALRINAGLTVKDIQNVFGFETPQAIYKWERGASIPAVDNLVILAKIYGISVDEILILVE